MPIGPPPPSATIKRVYERYGFEPVETPLIEYTDTLGKFLPDQDRPNEGVFSFRDDDAQDASSGEAATGKQGEWLSLRYDLTAPLARYVAENYERLPKPYRSYRYGWVFRNEKPGPGRFRVATSTALSRTPPPPATRPAGSGSRCGARAA